ncbi:MAG TPA: FkbM family methyltransferase [Gammaproteobacteria bacterium]|nr:FkbM family methyltransferase [Gammaproteobacteria bacterium]
MKSLTVRPAPADALAYARAAADAWRGESVRLGGLCVAVPGTRSIRLSVVGGNIRMHRLIDAVVEPGATVVDVGANIGYNTIYAARRVGPAGRVVAVEPTPDNLAVLERNVAAAGLPNVVVERVAAGRAAGTCRFYVRGDTSAVNSLFPESCYAAVTDVLEVPVQRLDDIVDGGADLVKIDVEGAELDVLEGMPRLLGVPGLALVAEWHPTLQRMAGYAPDALPRWLLDRGWRLHAASHFTVRPLTASDLPALTARLERARKPVELLARRA